MLAVGSGRMKRKDIRVRHREITAASAFAVACRAIEIGEALRVVLRKERAHPWQNFARHVLRVLLVRQFVPRTRWTSDRASLRSRDGRRVGRRLGTAACGQRESD